MEMKLDCQLIKRLRTTRAWSQEELAVTAGLSLRTIQRVEADGVASIQTQKAISEALNVDPSRLVINVQQTETKPDTQNQSGRKQFRFQSSVLYYLVAGLHVGGVAVLWILQFAFGFVGFLFIFNGIFNWESSPYTVWQSTGNSVLVTIVIIVPSVFLIRWILKHVKSIAVVRSNTQEK